jgi:predicted nuclease with TOPRIM domain
MEDPTAKLERLRIEAEDCDLIGRLATDDKKKRELFQKLAMDLRLMAGDVEAAIAGQKQPYLIRTRVPRA